MSASVITKNQKIDFHGITGTVAAINNDEVVIHFGAGDQRIVRTLSRAEATYFVDKNVFGVRAQLSRPVNNEQGKYAGCDSLYITDNHSKLDEYVVEISLVANAGAMGAEERLSPHKTAVLWWLQGLPEKPEIVVPKGAKRYKPELLDEAADHVTDADDMVSREEHEKALKAAVETAAKVSMDNSTLVQQKEELTALVREAQDSVNRLLDERATLERKVEALMDLSAYEYDWNGDEKPAGVGKRAEQGWTLYQLQFSADNTKMGATYRRLKPIDTAPTPLQAGASVVPERYSEGQTATASTPAGLQLTFNRVQQPVMRRGETRRIPDELIEQANAEVRHAVGNAMEAARRQYASKPLLALGAFQHAINTD